MKWFIVLAGISITADAINILYRILHKFDFLNESRIWTEFIWSKGTLEKTIMSDFAKKTGCFLTFIVRNPSIY